jgi:iron complex transport system permease protein
MSEASVQSDRLRALTRPGVVFGGLALVLLGTALLALTTGAASVDLSGVWKDWKDGTTQAAASKFVLFELRLPRVIGAILVGAILAQSGAAMQGLFRNPLADPALIGISAGAAVGAIASMLLIPESFRAQHPLGLLQMPLAGLLGGWLTAVAVYKTGNRGGRVSVTGMLLAGIAINAFAGAVIGLFIFVADDQQLRSINFWMLGSLGHISWGTLAWFSPLLIASMFGLCRYTHALDALLIGEAQAYHLGFDVRRIQRAIIFFIAAGVGTAVALTGVIGFVGLVVPHILRLVFGPAHQVLIPASAFLGGILLLLADTGARVVVAPAELPVGILTALIGTPFFFFLILKNRHLAV